MRLLATALLLVPFGLMAQEDIRPINRKGMMFKLVDQKKVELSPATGKYGYTIIIKDSKKKPLANAKVSLFDAKNKIKYQSVTNDDGEVKFLVDSGSTYELDIEKNEAVKIMSSKRVKYGSETVEIYVDEK